MRTLFLLLIFIWNLGLAALQIIADDLHEDINLHKYSRQNLQTLITEREGEQEVWRGVSLTSILDKYTDFSKIVLRSDDGYQVELSSSEAGKALLALYNNNETIRGSNRLIVPQKRQMFWIKEVTQIELQAQAALPALQQIIIAETWLQKFGKPHQLLPFKDSVGYFFDEVASSILLFLQAEYQLVAADGVQHNLDYEKYLQKAILSQNGLAYDVKSPDMPGGMWLKDIAYIRVYDRALVFASQLQNWSELQQLTGLQLKPGKIKIDGQIYSYRDFRTLPWQNYEIIQFYY
jgi:hypothetical protein